MCWALKLPSSGATRALHVDQNCCANSTIGFVTPPILATVGLGNGIGGLESFGHTPDVQNHRPKLSSLTIQTQSVLLQLCRYIAVPQIVWHQNRRVSNTAEKFRSVWPQSMQQKARNGKC